MLIYNSFGTYKILEILKFCFKNNIILYRLLSYTSYKLQPYNVAVFALLKVAYHEQVDQLERGGVNIINKQHFTSLFSAAREKAFTLKNIKAGFVVSGLFLFNLDKVFRSMLKPPADLNVLKANEVKVRSCPQDVVLQTPVTPVLAEGFMLLQNLIIKQDTYALDNTSKQKLERHVLKLTKAGQMFLIKDAF